MSISSMIKEVKSSLNEGIRHDSNRELSTLPINPTVLTNLTRRGFMVVEDIVNLTPSHLTKEVNISEEQASELLQKIKEYSSKPKLKSRSAWNLLHQEHESLSIITFSESFDGMLDGGVTLNKITEFSGGPGTGKSQMCLQLSVDVQIPKELDGPEGEVIYVDTEGSFIPERFVQIAQATIDHCQSILTQGLQGTSMSDFNLEKILRGIHYFRCQDYCELAAVLQQIPDIIATHAKIKLLVVDNVATPVRQGFDDLLAQNQFLSSIGQTFVKFAKQFGLAVVLTNQMTTKVDSVLSKSQVIPALGETWSHVPNVRVNLYGEKDQRRALLYKSPNKQETSCLFQITAHGIRDVVAVKTDDETKAVPTQSLNQEYTNLMNTDVQTGRKESVNEKEDENPAKRTRIA